MTNVLFRFTLLVSAVFCGSVICAQTFETEKEAHIATILTTVTEVSQLASDHNIKRKEGLDDTTRGKVYQAVERTKSAKDVVTLALIFRAILGARDAADVAYDRVVDEAFWHCVNLISEDTSPEGILSLKRLWRLSDTDAGETILFREAIQHQETKRRKQRQRK